MPAFVKMIGGVTALVLVALLVFIGLVLRPIQGLAWIAAGVVAVIGVVNTLSYGGR